jgi:hypothetical protein
LLLLLLLLLLLFFEFLKEFVEGINDFVFAFLDGLIGASEVKSALDVGHEAGDLGESIAISECVADFFLHHLCNGAEAWWDIGGVVEEQGEVIAGGGMLEELESGGGAVEEERGGVSELFGAEGFEDWEGFVVESMLYEPACEPELEVAAEEGIAAGPGEVRGGGNLSVAAGIDELSGGVIGEGEGVDEEVESFFGGELADAGGIGPVEEYFLSVVLGDVVLVEPVLELGADCVGGESGEGGSWGLGGAGAGVWTGVLSGGGGKGVDDAEKCGSEEVEPC